MSAPTIVVFFSLHNFLLKVLNSLNDIGDNGKLSDYVQNMSFWAQRSFIHIFHTNFRWVCTRILSIFFTYIFLSHFHITFPNTNMSVSHLFWVSTALLQVMYPCILTGEKGFKKCNLGMRSHWGMNGNPNFKILISQPYRPNNQLTNSNKKLYINCNNIRYAIKMHHWIYPLKTPTRHGISLHSFKDEKKTCFLVHHLNWCNHLLYNCFVQVTARL